jgi:transposase-like protein
MLAGGERIWFCMGTMQIRQSSFTGDRPPCPQSPAHRVHGHGCYDRFANCNDHQRQGIPRFLCTRCGRTISVLPDQMLPYRAASVKLVQEHFDAGADQTAPPAVTEKEKGCLVRAWLSFSKHVTVLGAVLGQMIKPVKPNATELWKQLKQQGNLEVILLRLAHPFNTSLLRDYRCLQPWPGTT